MAKVSFKRGTTAQKARSAIAEDLKRRGRSHNPFAEAAAITKRSSRAGRKRLAEHGLRSPVGRRGR